MKASISATRSSSIVIVTRCIASTIRVQYDDFLLTSYSRIPTVLTPIRARLAQRRYRIDRAARALEPSDGLCCGNAGGRGVLKATRWSVLAVASIFGLPQQGLAQSPTPPDAPGGPPAAGERPTGQTLPTINISTKRAKPRAKPVVTAGAPQTAPATPSVPQPPPYPPPHAGGGWGRTSDSPEHGKPDERDRRRSQCASGDAPRRSPRSGARPHRDAAQRRRKSQPVFPARLQSRPRH